MTTAMDTVGAFYDAFHQRDFPKLRGLITDDFTFKGPMMNFPDPDAFISGVSGMPYEAVAEQSRFIVDGDRVAHAFVWKMTAPSKADIPMCEVLQVANGKVRSSELFFDSRLFPTSD